MVHTVNGKEIEDDELTCNFVKGDIIKCQASLFKCVSDSDDNFSDSCLDIVKFNFKDGFGGPENSGTSNPGAFDLEKEISKVNPINAARY